MSRMSSNKSPKTHLLVAGAVSALMSALMLGACSNTPTASPTAAPAAAAPRVAPAPAAPAAQPPARAVSPSTPQGQAVPSSRVASVRIPPHLDAASDVSKKRSVYFDFDESLLKPEFEPLIELQGKYLMANPSLAVKIEGNTDERGGAEYNLALGQRRAEAVRKALKVYGVKDSQMEAISWGKERPRASAHDESAWAQNRRADINYPAR